MALQLLCVCVNVCMHTNKLCIYTVRRCFLFTEISKDIWSKGRCMSYTNSFGLISLPLVSTFLITAFLLRGLESEKAHLNFLTFSRIALACMSASAFLKEAWIGPVSAAMGHHLAGLWNNTRMCLLRYTGQQMKTTFLNVTSCCSMVLCLQLQ